MIAPKAVTHKRKRAALDGTAHDAAPGNMPAAVSMVPNRKSKVAAAGAALSLSLAAAAESERKVVEKRIQLAEIEMRQQLDELIQYKRMVATVVQGPLGMVRQRQLDSIESRLVDLTARLEVHADAASLVEFDAIYAMYNSVYQQISSKPETIVGIVEPLLLSGTADSASAVYQEKLSKIVSAMTNIVLAAIVEDFRAACRGSTHIGPLECVKQAYANFMQLHMQYDEGPCTLSWDLSMDPAAQMIFDSIDQCPKCKVPLLLVTIQSKLVCPRCGRSEVYLDTTNAITTYVKESDTTSPYKRINHLDDNLKCMQAKESKVVPDNIMLMILHALFKDVPRDNPEALAQARAEVTEEPIRFILKALNLRRYYDNVPQIHMRVTGIRPPQMTPTQEDRVRHRFRVIQGPFENHCPPNRKNFLPYFYIIYKICVIEGWYTFLPRCRLPKGKDKRAQADQIWKKICADLEDQDPSMDWPFQATPPPPPPLPDMAALCEGSFTAEFDECM